MDYSFLSTAITRRRPITIRQSLETTTITTIPEMATNDDDDDNNNTTNNNSLKRSLTLMDLIFYGVGCSVGAGIYSLVGIGANLAGPSIALSFALCGIACCFTSLSYAEFAARVPLAGSAYTFTYVSFGELCGWLVGWNLTLGYAISAAVVARSWAEYVVGFLQGILGLSSSLSNSNSWLSWSIHAPIPLLGPEYTCAPLAMVIVGLCTIVLVTGAKESTRFNMAMTILNLSVLGFVLLAGTISGTMEYDNLTPVFPHGIAGMARGAGLVFFAYLGFDMVSCLSEEVSNPSKNLPRGIVGSLIVSMTIYVAVSIVVVGMAPISLLGEQVPIVNALLANACCSHADQISLAENAQPTCLSYNCSPILHPTLYFGSRLVSFGAIFGLTTATFACLMGQPRIFYSMAKDGLLFKIYAKVHPKTGVPTIGTILTGIGTALIACLIDLEALANAISLGTLQVFTFVNAGVIVLRMRPPGQTSSSFSASSIPFDADDDNDDDDDSPTYEEFSPLVRDPRAALLARSLGLVKQSSREIRESIRTTLYYATTPPLNVRENGSKPHIFTGLFTLCAILASVGISNHWHWGMVLLLVLMGMTNAWLLSQLPRAKPPDTFTCPCVPLVPLMGILCNCYMMGSMPLSTWSLISLWLLLGLLFYFGYGIHHSELRNTNTKSDGTNNGNNIPQAELTRTNLLPPTTNYHSIQPSASSEF